VPINKTAAMVKPKTVDDYLASAPKEQRAALTKLRRTIKAAAPSATESLSYGMVGYKVKGQRLTYFGHWKSHIALYGTSGRFIKAHATELKPYVTTKGTLRFPADQPLPERLVSQIVKARVAEIQESG
jgi:uncharacterized protein YdhG (YjbR/CyaY superfamily)